MWLRSAFALVPNSVRYHKNTKALQQANKMIARGHLRYCSLAHWGRHCKNSSQERSITFWGLCVILCVFCSIINLYAHWPAASTLNVSIHGLREVQRSTPDFSTLAASAERHFQGCRQATDKPQTHATLYNTGMQGLTVCALLCSLLECITFMQP